MDTWSEVYGKFYWIITEVREWCGELKRTHPISFQEDVGELETIENLLE